LFVICTRLHTDYWAVLSASRTSAAVALYCITVSEKFTAQPAYKLRMKQSQDSCILCKSSCTMYKMNTQWEHRIGMV
jgi:hypothetical protein